MLLICQLSLSCLSRFTILALSDELLLGDLLAMNINLLVYESVSLVDICCLVCPASVSLWLKNISARTFAFPVSHLAPPRLHPRGGCKTPHLALNDWLRGWCEVPCPGLFGCCVPHFKCVFQRSSHTRNLTLNATHHVRRLGPQEQMNGIALEVG